MNTGDGNDDTSCRRWIGGRRLHYDVTESTNDRAAEHAGDLRYSGLVVTADRQSRGRGSHGRSWEGGSAESLLMSVLVHPPDPLRRPVVLTAWAAVAAAEAVVELTGLQVRIKWPNDLLIQGKKICGILTEGGVRPGSAPVPYFVVGIGLNINQSADSFEQAGLPYASSMAIAAGRKFDPSVTADRVIQRLNEEYGRAEAGDLLGIEACWKWRIGLLGRPVVVETTSGEFDHGRLLECAFDGVVWERSDRQHRKLRPEEIRHLRSP